MAVQIIVADHPVLILVFGMKDCPACESFIPRFRKVAQKHNTIPAYAVDCNKQTDAADRFRISVTPTTLILKNGKVLQKFEGEGTMADAEHLFRYAEKL